VNPLLFLRRGIVRHALFTYLFILGILWGVAILVVSAQTFLFHRAYPYDTILFIPAVRFTDFTIFYPRFEHYGQGDIFFSAPGFPFTYPAPLLICFLGIWKTSVHHLRAYFCLVLGFALSAAFVSFRAVFTKWYPSLPAIAAVISASLVSFPLMFLLDRANLEGFVWIAASIGLFCLVRRHYSVAAVFLALAAAMKLFPGVLLILLLAKRRYREFALAIFSWFTFTLGSLVLTGPSFAAAAKGIAGGMDFFRRTQILEFRPSEVGFDHSLFSCVKQVAFRFIHDVPRLNAVLPRIYFVYAVISILAFGGLYLLRLRKMPVLSQLLALSALSITLPFVSYEYTLVHLIAPFTILVLFLSTDVSSGRVPLDRNQILSLLLPFAILFAPMSFLLRNGFGFGGQVKTIVLLWLVYTASRIRLPSSLFSELSDRMVMEFRLEITQPGSQLLHQPGAVAISPGVPRQ
jgi:Glycosyltransferase family 87